MAADPDLLPVAVPPLPLTGGCSCGAVRYRVTGEPLVFYVCHCTECQRHTSSAFGETLRIRVTDFECTGTVRLIERLAASGARRQGWFCPLCGVRIWHATTGSDEINVKAGTLDDTRWLQPAGHIWVRSRQPFMSWPAGTLVYDGQPEPGYLQLKQRWRLMTTAGGSANAPGASP